MRNLAEPNFGHFKKKALISLLMNIENWNWDMIYPGSVGIKYQNFKHFWLLGFPPGQSIQSVHGVTDPHPTNVILGIFYPFLLKTEISYFWSLLRSMSFCKVLKFQLSVPFPV